MNRKELMALFNKYPRIDTLSTANTEGEVNVAVFGSPRMIDENTVVMEPGETVMDWKGARVYLEATDMKTEGKFYDEIKQNIAKAAGKQASDMIHAAIRFKITEVRPIVDLN